MDLIAKETLRLMEDAEGKPELSGREFAKAWRKGITVAIRETCRCAERYRFDRKLKAHCALDAQTELILDLMPVLFRVPGVLDGWKGAIAGTHEEADAYGEKVVADLLEHWVPAKERLRTMKRLHECFGE